MNQERLEWILSGLNQYKLTQNEDKFVKLVENLFSQNNILTEHQEERLEVLYKEKSKLLPNKNYFSPKESNPSKKAKITKVRPKFIPF